MKIEKVSCDFSVCKVKDYSMVDLNVPFCFTGKTDQENSLVCPSDQVPANATEREDGWKAFRVQGTLEFSLIGILAGISAILAEHGIGIFVISTFDTDYILTKKETFDQAAQALSDAGYEMVG